MKNICEMFKTLREASQKAFSLKLPQAFSGSFTKSILVWCPALQFLV